MVHVVAFCELTYHSVSVMLAVEGVFQATARPSHGLQSGFVQFSAGQQIVHSLERPGDKTDSCKTHPVTFTGRSLPTNSQQTLIYPMGWCINMLLLAICMVLL